MPWGPSHGRGCPCELCDIRREKQRAVRARGTVKRYIPPPAIEPKDVRTYGEPWDSIIAAGAYYSVPPSGLPRAKGDVK